MLFVPGRLCLFGEHSDWAGGWRRVDPSLTAGACLVSGTDQGLRAQCSAEDGTLHVRSTLPDGRSEGPLRVAIDSASLDAVALGGGFFSHAAGSALEMVTQFGVGGVALSIASDLPEQRGLSSSAALCVLVVRAFSSVYGLGLTPREEIELAYAGERRTGSECGRMDQICAYGRRLTALRFDADALDVEIVSPCAPLHLLIVDLRRGKDTRRILRELNACFPAAPGALAAGVRDALGPRNGALVARARAALERGDAAALGALMIEAQAVFDRQVAPACAELEAPRLHAVLGLEVVRALSLGGKGVGSQGDGCAQFVCAGEGERAELAARLARDEQVDCLPLTIEAGQID